MTGRNDAGETKYGGHAAGRGARNTIDANAPLREISCSGTTEDRLRFGALINSPGLTPIANAVHLPGRS